MSCGGDECGGELTVPILSPVDAAKPFAKCICPCRRTRRAVLESSRRERRHTPGRLRADNSDPQDRWRTYGGRSMNVESSLCVEASCVISLISSISVLDTSGGLRTTTSPQLSLSGESWARVLPRAKGQVRAGSHPRRLHRKPHVAQVRQAIVPQDGAIVRRSWCTVRVSLAAATPLRAWRRVSALPQPP